MNTPDTRSSRRDFLKNTSAAVAALGFPAILTGAPPSGKIKIGFIGCGGRGSGAANQALTADSDCVLWAMGDAFEDKITASLESLTKSHPDKVDVPKERQFTGFDGYKQLIDSGIDVALLCSTPAFRPVACKCCFRLTLRWALSAWNSALMPGTFFLVEEPDRDQSNL